MQHLLRKLKTDESSRQVSEKKKDSVISDESSNVIKVMQIISLRFLLQEVQHRADIDQLKAKQSHEMSKIVEKVSHTAIQTDTMMYKITSHGEFFRAYSNSACLTVIPQ